MLVILSALAFVQLLYLIGAGETGGDTRVGEAHAKSNAINGYSGLVKLAEGEGFNIRTSRSPSGLETTGLLILAPSLYTDPAELGEILEERQYRGPTMVILPKWVAGAFPRRLPKKVKDKLKDDWVQLYEPQDMGWVSELPTPYDFDVTLDSNKQAGRWAGLGYSGRQATPHSVFARTSTTFTPLVTDQDGGALAIDITGEEDSDFYNDSHLAIFVVDPDLVNNYGLADPQRAGVAMELIRTASYDDEESEVVFDLTLNGFGGSTNLLTLAFQPPFLAATLCLIAALLMVGWRAFQRFGGTAVHGPAIAFGKSRLIANSAGLIMRARRHRLLAAPYVSLIQARIARLLLVDGRDTAAIDAAIARRLPDEQPFTPRAATMRTAGTIAELVRAAAALKELEGKLQK